MEPQSLLVPWLSHRSASGVGYQSANGADLECSILQLTLSLLCFPQAETRAEFAERSVAKLEKTIDDLEGKMSPPALCPSFLGQHWTHHAPGGAGQCLARGRGWAGVLGAESGDAVASGMEALSSWGLGPACGWGVGSHPCCLCPHTSAALSLLFTASLSLHLVSSTLFHHLLPACPHLQMKCMRRR